jgi:hypothetical protein
MQVQHAACIAPQLGAVAHRLSHRIKARSQRRIRRGEHQMNSNRNDRPSVTITTLVLAGLAGGMAEVAWVAIYSAFVPLSSAEVLRQIVASASPALAASRAAPALGMLMHLTLAVALAICYGRFVWAPVRHRFRLGISILTGMAGLAVVWMLNFFVLLPVVNPAFVLLMPFSVSLASKLLFGAAMGWVLFDRGRNLAGGYSVSLRRLAS